MRFFSGLAIGCPLSCYFFLLIVDPLLHALSAVPGVLGLSAFADDWSLFCRDLQTLFALRPLFQRFECASGQRINIPKSGILPTRPMTRAEQCCVRIFWGTIQILDKARILGLWIGFAATIDDQYAAALDKFSRTLQDFPPCDRAGPWQCA